MKTKICSRCEGTGEICVAINGDGSIGDGDNYTEDVCPNCNGTGKIKEDKIQTQRWIPKPVNKTFRESAEKIIGEYLPIEKLSEENREGLLDKLTTEAMTILDEMVN